MRPIDLGDVQFVPLHSAPLGAGQGGNAQLVSIEGHIGLTKEWLRHVAGIQPELAFAAHVFGPSMEELLSDGDLVLGQYVQEIERDSVYAVDFNGDLLVKHVERRRGQVRLVSHNTRYSPIEVTSSDEIRVLGEVRRKLVQLGN